MRFLQEKIIFSRIVEKTFVFCKVLCYNQNIYEKLNYGVKFYGK